MKVLVYLFNNKLKLKAICGRMNSSRVPTDQGKRENFEDFFQSGKTGKTESFQPKSGKQFSNQRTIFQNYFKTF